MRHIRVLSRSLPFGTRRALKIVELRLAFRFSSSTVLTGHIVSLTSCAAVPTSWRTWRAPPARLPRTMPMLAPICFMWLALSL